MLARLPSSSTSVAVDSFLRIRIRIRAAFHQPHLGLQRLLTAQLSSARIPAMPQDEFKLDAHLRRPKKLICT